MMIYRQKVGGLTSSVMAKTSSSITWKVQPDCEYGEWNMEHVLLGREVLGDVVYLGHYSSEEEWTKDKEEEMKVSVLADRGTYG